MQTHDVSHSDENMDRTAAFYASPTYVQRGGGTIPIFSGSRRQRGGSILGAIKNFFMPLLPGLKNYAVKKAKTAAAGLIKNVASDVQAGRSFGQSLKSRGLQSAVQLGKDAVHDGTSLFTGSRKRANARKRIRPPKRARKVANF